MAYGKVFDFFQIRGFRAEMAAVSQQGILCGKTVVWVCGLYFIRNLGLLSVLNE